MIITVDGLSGAGKGTLASGLASHYSLPLLETGLLWRKLAVYMNRVSMELTDESAVASLKFFLSDAYNESEIRDGKTSETSSIISGFPQARDIMDRKISNWATRPGGGVLDGREGGVSHAPYADAKFFLVAEAETRAERRFGENSPDLPEGLTGILARDAREIVRPVAPSIPAIDALIIDTTYMGIDIVFERAKEFISSKALWNELLRKATF